MSKKILGFGLVAAVGVAGAVFYFKKKQSDTIDAVLDSTYTGLREWNSSLQREVVRSHRDARDVCIAVLTVNGIKKNDVDSIKEVEKHFALAVRGSDLLARNDSGEFFVLFPEAGLDEGYEAVERLQEALPPTTSIAAGIAVWDHCETAAELVARAVNSLQGDKKAARAKISISETPQGVS